MKFLLLILSLLGAALFALLGPPTISFQQVAAAIAAAELPGGFSPSGLSLRLVDLPKQALRRLMLPAGYRLPDVRGLRLGMSSTVSG